LCPVGNAREKKLSNLVQFVFKVLFANFKDISDVGHSKKVLHVVESIRFRIGICKFGIDLGFAQGLTSHLQIPDELIVLAGVVGDFDDLSKVRRILGFDVRF